MTAPLLFAVFLACLAAALMAACANKPGLAVTVMACAIVLMCLLGLLILGAA